MDRHDRELAHFARSPYLAPFDGTFSVAKARTSPPKSAPDKAESKRLLAERVEEIDTLQEMLYASDGHALLLVFQALDAAGKDGTIRAVFTGINPAGCQIFNFKRPSEEELDHDFLWRTSRSLPERGRIGVFNRSYYEEVLVARVHPELLEHQRLPHRPRLSTLWKERFESIREHEHHLARNGTLVIKFWLHVSMEEQKRRLLARIDEPRSNWKVQASDVEERAYRREYMKAYEAAINETSRPWAPWYVIPADDKAFMRLAVADIVRDVLKGMKLSFPELPKQQKAGLAALRKKLMEAPRGKKR